MTEPAALDPEVFGPDSACFGCAPRHPIGFRLTFTRAGDEVLTSFTPHDALQGPPGIMHGGLVTTLADELAAWTVIGLKKRFGFTVALQAKLQRPLRIHVPIEGRGKILRASSRLVDVGVTLAQADHVAYVGEFTFALLDERGAERLLGAPLPAAWKAFARHE